MKQPNELEVVNIRLVREPSLYSTKQIKSVEDAVELMQEELMTYDREVLCVLNLKENGEVLNMNLVSMGSINASIVSIRELFKSSILANAGSILVMHNHPSGTINPSKADREVTQKIYQAGCLMDIPLIDHIIVGAATKERYSFLEAGLLKKEEQSKVKEKAHRKRRTRL